MKKLDKLEDLYNIGKCQLHELVNRSYGMGLNDGATSVIKKKDSKSLEKHRELRKQFEKETGSHPFADQQYIKWLEQRVVNMCEVISDKTIIEKKLHELKTKILRNENINYDIREILANDIFEIDKLGNNT